MKRFTSLLFLGGLIFSLVQPAAQAAALVVTIPTDCGPFDVREECKAERLSPFQKLSMLEQAKVWTELNFIGRARVIKAASGDVPCYTFLDKTPTGSNLYQTGEDLVPFGLHEEAGTGGSDGRRSCRTSTFSSLLSAAGYSDMADLRANNPVTGKPRVNFEGSNQNINNNVYNHFRSVIFGCGSSCTDSFVNSQKASAYYKALIEAFHHGNGCNAGTEGDRSATIQESVGGKVVPKTYKYQDETVNVGWGIYGNRNEDDGKMKCSTIAAELAKKDTAQSAITWQTSLDKITGVNNLLAGESTSNTASNEILCNLGAIGWIICPVTQFIARVTDLAYQGIENLLVFDPIGFDTTKPLYIAWSNARNLANIFFIGALFIIIYSQLTGVGISNYGIKKLLPRIVISVIFVNTSYFICAFLIDLSNIFGASIDDWLIAGANTGVGGGSQSNAWTNLISAVLAGGGLAGVAFGASGLGWLSGVAFTMLIGASVAIGLTLLLLLVIKAIVPLWIVSSAFAGVSWLLPGTTRVFNIWRTIGRVLLVLYPIISIVYAVGGIAGNIIRAGTGGP